MKAPAPEASVVLLPTVVGPVEVLQQTPRAVTAAPPSEVTLPPQLADVEVIAEIPEVVTVGSSAVELKKSSLP